MFYYKHQSDMDVLLYVYVDVPSDYLCYGMFYYKHHSDINVLQYVHIDVPSDYLCY